VSTCQRLITNDKIAKMLLKLGLIPKPEGA
jgi:hypothetical protein